MTFDKLLDFLKSLEFLKKSLSVVFSLGVTCWTILYLPESYFPFDINTFREQYGIRLFFILAFSGAIFVYYIIYYPSKMFFSYSKRKYETHKKWKIYEKIINSLSDEEKILLREKYNQNDPTLTIDLNNRMHKHLQTVEIISQNVGLSPLQGTKIAGFIQPWIFELIKKKPKLFEIKSISNKGKKSDSFLLYKGFLE